MRTLRPATLLAVAGTAFLVGGAVLGLHRPSGAPPRDLGTVPAAVTLPAGPRSQDDVPSLARTRARIVPPPSPPVAIRLPGEKQALVMPIRAGRDGELDPPERVSEVGWWQGGSAVGDADGSIVLAGHVDAASQGIGVFAELWKAHPGQTVEVVGKDGREVRYRITGRRSYPRNRPLPASLFAGDVANRLVLITCAGRFDPQTAHYADSLAVFAVPT